MSDQESLTPPEVESLSDLETDATCDIDEKGEDTACDDALPQTPDEEVYRILTILTALYICTAMYTPPFNMLNLSLCSGWDSRLLVII